MINHEQQHSRTFLRRRSARKEKSARIPFFVFCSHAERRVVSWEQQPQQQPQVTLTREERPAQWPRFRARIALSNPRRGLTFCRGNIREQLGNVAVAAVHEKCLVSLSSSAIAAVLLFAPAIDFLRFAVLWAATAAAVRCWYAKVGSRIYRRVLREGHYSRVQVRSGRRVKEVL